MNREAIPDDIRRFVLTSIPSVPYLEALLLLRATPDEEWDGRKVAQRLYMSEKAASALLDELHASDMAIMTGQVDASYRYAPGSDELRQIIDRLADTYSRHLVAVTNLIHSKTSKKAQQFADAFKLRKDS
jgi:hypothetical protein